MEINPTRSNNFHFLRFLAATLVIFSHCYTLQATTLISIIGDMAVGIFFIISGFLITQSWLADERVHTYLFKRILRIIPGLIVVTLFTIFIIGPVNTSLSLKYYFSNWQTFTYVKNIFLYPLQFSLPGVFLRNTFPVIVNHSMWTLPVEFTAYLLILIFGLLRLMKTKFFIPVVVVFLLFFDVYSQSYIFYFRRFVYDMSLYIIVSHLIFFFLGSFFYLYRNKIKFYYWLFVPAILLVYLTIRIPIFSFIYHLSLAYAVLCVAFLLTPRLSAFKKFGDPSYGMYLFSMPLQQTYLHFFKTVYPMLLFVLTMVPVTVIAYASWHVIEAPMLKLKKRL